MWMVFFLTKSAQLQRVHRVLSWVHYFSWYTSMTYQNLTTDKTWNPSLLMALLYRLLIETYNLQQNVCVGPTKTGKVVYQMENKTKSWENQGRHILQVPSRQKLRTHPKTLWWEAQNLSSSETSRNHFRLQIHFPKTLWENPRALQHQVPPNQTFS